MNQSRLQGRVALVTGAAQGVGRATAAKLIAEGADVFVNDIDAAVVATAAQELGAIALPGDLTDATLPDRLLAQILEQRPSLDIIVNNAGYIWNGALVNQSDEQRDAMLDIHVTAPLRILRAYGRWLRQLHAKDTSMRAAKSSTSRRYPV
jgi:3-oxoacyl-[acyl-carrier protein] reductase